MKRKTKETPAPLPVRLSTHIKESDSREIFTSLIKPWIIKSWIPNDVDYGIDAIIEIIHPQSTSGNQLVSGKRISVQLKSSDSAQFDKKNI